MTQASLFTESKFVGWFRIRGERWKPVVSGDTDPEAFRKLLEHSSKIKAHASDLLVLPVGVKP